MQSTLNSVCTLDSICRNRLILEVMPNPMRRNELQFYYIGAINKDIHYVPFDEFDKQFKHNLSNNHVLYITFCGINRENGNVPEYYYLTFFGDEVMYKGTEKKNGCCVLEIELNKRGNSIQKELNGLMKDNIGVFLQSYN
jgi:hypothetical protein